MKEPVFEYSIKVLLIGEARETQELLGDTLKAVGYDSSVVETVNEAIAVLERSSVDLVICDPRRVDGSWSDFLEYVKRRKTRVPVIFITDHNDKDKNKYLKAGTDGILTKPFRISKAEELIAATLLNYDKLSIIPEKKSKKILVADDDEAILSVLNNALTILGYDTVLAKSGEKALEKFKKDLFDILITDYMMPGLSGKELISAVKEIKPDLPVIMITGYPLAYPPDAAKLEGIDAYLAKPFRIKQLKEVISRLLQEGD